MNEADWLSEWMDERLDGRMERWMNGWMDRQMNGQKAKFGDTGTQAMKRGCVKISLGLM